MRGPVSVSLQFRAVVRQCTRPFAYESGSEERTEAPEACMWRPWYEDKQSLAIMQIPVVVAQCLKKKKKKRTSERRKEKGLFSRHLSKKAREDKLG